jgi:hypothetical protein
MRNREFRPWKAMFGHLVGRGFESGSAKNGRCEQRRGLMADLEAR